MMLFKLSLKNIQKSIKDYIIYFVTLVIGVAIFYVFNSLEAQSVMMKISESTQEIIELMINMMSAISVLVSFILGFLIVYASNFLLRRRKQEFAVYMLLGMGKQKISFILLIETVLIGLVSMVAGLALGVFASQGMSLVVAAMFEADMKKYHFIFSGDAMMKTILYFCVIYVVVLLLNTVVIGRAKLIDLLTARGKMQKNAAKNPFLCMLAFLAAVVLLSTAYYAVTADGGSSISSERELITQIVKGVLGTVLVFWSLSGLMVYEAKKNQKFYFKNMNSFTVKELASRINTTVISGSIICLMLFVTICVLASAMSVRKSLNDNLKKMAPADVNMAKSIEEENPYKISEVFDEIGLDTGMFEDVVEFRVYQSDSVNMYSIFGEYVPKEILDDEIIGWYEERRLEIITAADYNRLARLYGTEEYTVPEGRYLILCNFDSYTQSYNEALADGKTIHIGDRELKPAFSSCKNGFVEMASNKTNMGIVVVSDSTDLSALSPCFDYYMANYADGKAAAGQKKGILGSKAVTDKEGKYTKEKIDRFLRSKKLYRKLNPEEGSYWTTVMIETKMEIEENSIGLTALVVFAGLYLGLIFMIAGAAILAIKQLSETSDSHEKYEILRRIGVEEGMLHRSVFCQCALFFGIPLLIALVHSIFGMQVSEYILETFGQSDVLYNMLTTGGIVVAVYGLYFVVTCLACRKLV